MSAIVLLPIAPARPEAPTTIAALRSHQLAIPMKRRPDRARLVGRVLGKWMVDRRQMRAAVLVGANEVIVIVPQRLRALFRVGARVNFTGECIVFHSGEPGLLVYDACRTVGT
jgi:hypothetical protein